MKHGPRLLIPFALLGTLLAAPSCGNGDGAEAAADAPSAEEKALQPIVDAVVTTHAALHREEGGDKAPAALVRRFIDREEGLVSARRKFLDEAGACRFACGGALTPLGKALMERLDPARLERHGFEGRDFDMPALGERVTAFTAARQKALTLPAPAEAAARVVAAHLGRKAIDRAVLTRELMAADGHAALTVAHVEDLGAQLQKLSGDEELLRDEASLEAELSKALLQYVVAWREAVTTGPAITPPLIKLVAGREDELVARMTTLANADDPGKALDALEPRQKAYRTLLDYRDRYRELARKGDCPKLPDKWTFKAGVRPGYEVVKLKERLACEGYYEGPMTEEYSDLARDAVKKYQRHHDMEETGYLDEGDLASLNVPMERRAEQLGLAAMRMREAREDELGDYYIRVNIPQYMLEVVEFGDVIKQQRVIVGTNKLDDNKVKLIQGNINRTPLLRTEIYEVVVNPDWILPNRVSKGEIIGQLKKNPKYLEENNIKKSKLDNGREVLVQSAGDDNVLGKIKFLLRNSNAIFLHDTNDRYLFTYRHRALSHGCMRVEDAVGFAEWMLVRDGWSEAEVKDTFKKESVQRGMDLHKPIPFVSVYRTVALSDEGLPLFLSDIYRYDKAFYDKDLPPVESVRWGDSKLRPNWVPKVDKEIVEGWRAEGKPAPRDYKPPK